MKASDGTGRLRFAGALLLAAMFAVGGLGGYSVAQLSGGGDSARADEPECEDRERNHGQYYESLGVDADQKARIDAILAARKQQIDRFWDENGPRMEQIVDSARAEIRHVLTPEQQAEADRRRAERRARHERQEEACRKLQENR